MSFTNMTEEEQNALLARAKLRGLTKDDLSSENDLVVEGRGLTMNENTRGLKSTVIKPKSLDELIAAIGPSVGLSESDRKAVTDSKVRALQRDQLKQVVRMHRKQPDNRRRRRPDDLPEQPDHESALLTNTLIKAVVQGVLSRESMEEFIGPLPPQLLERISIRTWLLPTITVQTGSPWIFNPEDPASVRVVVAYKLIVEPNARIVINGAAVSMDCIELEVQ